MAISETPAARDDIDDAPTDPEALRSEAFAASGYYPNRSPCPVGCKFCYERSLPEFYPKLKVARVRPKTPEQFDFYTDQLEKYHGSAIPTSPVTADVNGMVTYHSNSDFFAQGLTLEQYDRVVAANTATGAQPYVSTMGKGFDFETAKFLQERHPDAFRVRLSLLTYNDKIKADLIPKWEDSTDMRKITSILRYAHIYLLHFNCEQTLTDLREVDRLANRAHKPNIGIAVVHYTRKHSAQVQQYANDGFADFESLVRHLMSGKESFDGIGEIYFQHPAEGFAYRFRNFLRAKLAPYLLGPDDLLLCSRGALDVMRDLVVRNGATVLPVPDGLGGSTSFTTTLCTDDFARELTAILSEPRERPFKRVFIPAPVWWVSNRTCLNGGTIDDLRKAFPTVDFVPVDVPMDVLESRLSIREAYDWYNADLPTTRELTRNRRDALASLLGPNEHLTESGFVRRIVVEGAEDVALDPYALDDVEPDARLMVEYHEIVAERETLYSVPEPATRYTIQLDGREVPIRRTMCRRYPLPGHALRALFTSLFVERRPFVQVMMGGWGDLAHGMHSELADLERVPAAPPAKRRLPVFS